MESSMPNTPDSGRSRSRSRERIGKLLREGGDVFTVADAARILGLGNEDAAKTLARWCKQGWLGRVKRGIYIPIPVESISKDRALEDAWILIPDLFGLSYVGGWSAAEHWDLTEQIFRSICVFTTRPVAKRQQVIHNIPFVVKHVPTDHLFGLKVVWKKEVKLSVSDPTRTIVDMLSNLRAGGGISHIVDCFKNYTKSPQFKPPQLIEYAERLGNAAVFKRLGFLAERLLSPDHFLVMACKERLSKGNAQLDTALRGNKLITRWRLFVPAMLSFEMEPTA